MTRDEAVALIASRLGNRGSAFDTQIVTELKAKQVELELMPELPWFLRTKNTSLTTTASTQTVTLPSGFIMEDEEAKQFIVDLAGTYYPLTKHDYETLRDASFLEGTGFPEKYALGTTVMYLFPTPDNTYSLQLNYYSNDTVLSSNVTNQWLTYAPDVLYNGAGLEMAKFLRDPGASQAFDNAYNRALDRMWKQSESRRQAGLDAYVGG